jgi:hypothetical protein
MWPPHIDSSENRAWGTVNRISRVLGSPVSQLAKLVDDLETDDRRSTRRASRDHWVVARFDGTSVAYGGRLALVRQPNRPENEVQKLLR